MTAPEVRRRRLPLGELYVLFCTGLAVLLVLGIAPTLVVPALALLMLPVSIVGFAILLNVLFLVVDSGTESWAWTGGFVVAVALLAWLQMRIVRNVRADPAEMRPVPVTTGADTGL